MLSTSENGSSLARFIQYSQHTRSKFLLIAKAQLAIVVDLCPECGDIIQSILAPNCKTSRVWTHGETKLDTSFQFRAHFCVYRASNVLSIVSA